jgi:hypothetical protein
MDKKNYKNMGLIVVVLSLMSLVYIVYGVFYGISFVTLWIRDKANSLLEKKLWPLYRDLAANFRER